MFVEVGCRGWSGLFGISILWRFMVFGFELCVLLVLPFGCGVCALIYLFLFLSRMVFERVVVFRYFLGSIFVLWLELRLRLWVLFLEGGLLGLF